MKKAKILAVFGILLAMGITACNKEEPTSEGGDQQSQQTPVTSEQGGGETSQHTHKFGSWTVVPGKEPTCTEKGQEQRECECGEKEFRDKAALGHDFENGTVTADTSTCTADGKQTIKCSRCAATKEVDVKAHHRFGQDTDVAKKGDGYVGYKTAECSLDHALQIKIRALDGTLASGSSIKSGTADGYFKLNSNGNSMSWKFDYQPSSGKTGAIGKIYTRGFMDAWSSNSSKKYGVYSTSSQDTRDAGNFDFTVNGSLVDKTAYMQKTFEELTAGGEDSSAVGDNYSPIALIPVGDAVLVSGDNTFVYKRTGSYNFVISDIIFIGEEFAHEHTASATWSSDPNQHWHVCTAAGCPVEGGYKMDAANHTFEEVTPAADTETDPAHKAKAASCSEEGIKVEVCSVCQYRKETKLDKLAHTFPADGGWTVNKAATCDEPGERQHKCTVCEEIVKEVIPALGHDFSGGVAKAYEAGTGYIAAQAVNCANCTKSALKWSALDYNAELSTAASDEGKAPKSQDSGKAISLDTSTTQGMGSDHSNKGCHVIYEVNVPEAVENAGLAMLATEAPYRADMFDQMTNENSRGYYQNAEGEWVVPDSRYGIKVDGVEYMVAKNNGAIKGAGTTWYQFPGISLTLTAGIHKFEFFKYGGYDVNHYEFMLIGLSHVTPAHEHTYSAWQSNETNHWKLCTGEGCLDPEGTKYFEAEHNFGELQVETANTCTTDGAGKYVCEDCGYVKNVVIPAAHTWGDATAVEEANMSKYNKFECTKCDAIKLEFEFKSYVESGSTSSDAFAIKNESTPNSKGFFKLNKNGNFITFKFNYDSIAYGKIYQRGIMDNYNNGNSGRKYSDGGSGTENGCNFIVTCNGAAVDMSATKNIAISEMSKNGVDTGLGAAYSLAADCEIGPVSLKNGENTFTYKRLGSYNLANSHFVFVVENNNHEHHAGEAWQSDDTQHWHVCDAAGCPTPDAKMDAANHTFGDVIVDTAATCTEAGAGHKVCSVCGKSVNVVIPALGHDFEVGTADESGVSALTCKRDGCGATGIQYNGFTGDNAAANDNGKLNKGATLNFTVHMAAAGKARLFINAAYSNGNGNKTFASGWSIKGGASADALTAGTLTLNTSARADSVLKQVSTYTYLEIGYIEVDAAGDYIIQVTTYDSSAQARLMIDGNVRVVFQ